MFFGEKPMIEFAALPETKKVFAVSVLSSVSPPVPYVFRNYCMPDSHPSRYAGTCQSDIATLCEALRFLFPSSDWDVSIDLRVNGICWIGSVRYPVWKAGRASSAAPTYFPELEDGTLSSVGVCICEETPGTRSLIQVCIVWGGQLGPLRIQDGGVLANNPAAIAISEAQRLYPGVPIDCLVSLGTGVPTERTGPETEAAVCGSLAGTDRGVCVGDCG